MLTINHRRERIRLAVTGSNDGAATYGDRATFSVTLHTTIQPTRGDVAQPVHQTTSWLLRCRGLLTNRLLNRSWGLCLRLRSVA